MLLAIPLGIVSVICGIIFFLYQLKCINKKNPDNKNGLFIFLLILCMAAYVGAFSIISRYYSDIKPDRCLDTRNCVGNSNSALIIFLITIGTSLVLGVLTNIILNKIYKSGNRVLSGFSFMFYYAGMTVFTSLLFIGYNGIMIKTNYNTITTICGVFAIVSPVLTYVLITLVKMIRNMRK